MTPQPPAYSPAFAPPPPSQPANDPFAALGGGIPSSASPAPGAAPAAAAPPKPTVSNDDDEWNFASALPPSAPSQPKEHRLMVSNNNLRVDMVAGRTSASPNALNISFAFSNNTASQISELHFQIAVTKVRDHSASLFFFCPTIYVYSMFANPGYCRAMNSSSNPRPAVSWPPSRVAA